MPNTSKRGFASMNNEKQRVIASKGGRAAHAKGTAHEWSSAEARAAGRKGGESRGTRNRSSAPEAVSGFANHFLNQAGSSLQLQSDTQRTGSLSYQDPTPLRTNGNVLTESRTA